MRRAGALLQTACWLLGATRAHAGDFDFDEVFRHWGDSDHLGTRATVGASALRVSEPRGDQTAVGAEAELMGAGEAFKYGPGIPQTFRFFAFGALGGLVGSEGASFDGRIGGEAMFGLRFVLDADDKDEDRSRAWPRTEMFARAGFAFHVQGSEPYERRELEAPRFEVGVRHAGYSDEYRVRDHWAHDSYNLEARAVATLVPSASLAIGSRHISMVGAPAWGAQLDLVGVRPEFYATWLRTTVRPERHLDLFELRACLKLGPKNWSRHPYIACSHGWLTRDVWLKHPDAEALRLAVSFGYTG